LDAENRCTVYDASRAPSIKSDRPGFENIEQEARHGIAWRGNVVVSSIALDRPKSS
jgi:hypothetical protein